MKKRFESRGEKSKDAAMDTPIKDKDAGKEYVEEEDVSRIAMIERELNGVKDDVSEIKMLLKTLTEGKRVDGGLEEKESLNKEVEIEPKKEPDEGDEKSGGRQQSPQPKSNSKKRLDRLDHETLVRLCWSGEYLQHQESVFVNAPNTSLETLPSLSSPPA